MKGLGYGALAIGIIWLLVALNMDTSVATDFGRVNNIGLMASKQNHILIGGFITFCGLIMAIFGKSSQSARKESVKCPFCAELISPEAIKCKHCGSEVTPSVDDTAKPFPMHLIKPSDLYVLGPERKSIVDVSGVKKVAGILQEITPSMNVDGAMSAHSRAIKDIAGMCPKYLRDTFIADVKVEVARLKGL